MGDPLSASQHPTGTLVKYSHTPDIYYIDQHYQKRKVTSEQVLNDNRFQAQHVLNISNNITYNNGQDITYAEEGIVTVAGD